MEYKDQYYPYKDLCERGTQVINTKDLNQSNIDNHFYSIINILKDGIESEEVQRMMIHVNFENNTDLDLSIFDYALNLMFWGLCTAVNHPIWDVHLVFFDNITKKSIKEYIDNIFIDKYRKDTPFIQLNQTIDNVIGKFRDLRPFQMYLANTLNLEDTIDLMNKYPEFNDTVHFSVDGIPIEDVKEIGMEAANKQISYIKNSDHCLRDSFRTGEAISPKQYKEVAVNIGSKPDGQGSIFPHPIHSSFMNGGISTPEELVIESSVGRVAQILQKTNVGESGAFARALELNNQDSKLHDDPNYICDTVNFEEIVLDNDTMINMFDMRYYRENPNGVDKLLSAKSCDKKSLIGKKLYFRSPMTCASAARGQGICYKCYGDLAYTNGDINIGQISAEGLSSIYTQILLSAKHLLESLVVKMEWSPAFYDYFQITFNSIALKENLSFKGCKLIINEDIQAEEELDDIDYNNYITNFFIKTPDGTMNKIATKNADNLYFDKEFYNYLINMYPNNITSTEEQYYAEIDLNDLTEFSSLFIVEIKNNELSATMNKIEKLINNNSVISQYDRNSILKEFILTNIKGNIKLNSVHFEVLLMNQIRDGEDILEKPNWSIPNPPYKIIRLANALSDNPSITVRLQSTKVSNVLNNPINSKLCRASMSDVYFMEQPQNVLDPDYISDENIPLSDKLESKVVEPFTFDNPKLHCGTRYKK
jgi:hypothetical protein